MSIDEKREQEIQGERYRVREIQRDREIKSERDQLI